MIQGAFKPGGAVEAAIDMLAEAAKSSQGLPWLPARATAGPAYAWNKKS